MGAKAKKALPEAVLKRANDSNENSLLSENDNN
jgi:DNA recombination protein RmuC